MTASKLPFKHEDAVRPLPDRLIIELTAHRKLALRDALAPYVSAGRRVTGGARRQVRTSRKAPANGANTTEIREWAKAQGLEVKDRGRVPAELVVKFKAATGN